MNRAMTGILIIIKITRNGRRMDSGRDRVILTADKILRFLIVERGNEINIPRRVIHDNSTKACDRALELAGFGHDVTNEVKIKVLDLAGVNSAIPVGVGVTSVGREVHLLSPF